MKHLQLERLKNEEKLLILCSRISLNREEEEAIKTILNKDLDMNQFIALATKHKVLTLATRHLLRLDIDSNIHYLHKRYLEFNYLGNQKRNKALFQEFRGVMKAFHSRRVHAIPLKGTILVPEVYKDGGLRILNDLDFLISIDDRNHVSKVLQKIGYTVGHYNRTTDQIVSVSRKNELMWKMHIGNLYPHVKKVEDPFLKCVCVDFSYDVDLKKNYYASQRMIEQSIDTTLFDTPMKRLNAVDFLIHIAIHLYKEATNIQWLLLHHDINISKFCDIREFCIANKKFLDWENVARRAKELHAQEALFYSFYYMYYIYKDPFAQSLLEKLDIDDSDFIKLYGQNDYATPNTWRKSFHERFFALSNVDEVQETSKYEQYKRNDLL